MIKTLLILPCSAFFGWLGVMALLFPGGLLRGFGIAVSGPDGFNEIRAVYGGLPLMWSGLLLLALARPGFRVPIVLSVAAASLGMAIGRLISAGADHSLGRFPTIFLAVELVIAAALIGAAFDNHA